MSERKTVFGYLDRTAEIEIQDGDLPHWFQAGTAMFVTFRAGDSIPSSVMELWRDELIDWLRRQGVPMNAARRLTKQERLSPETLALLPENLQREFRRKRDRLWHRMLDQCHGDCLLKSAPLARIVADALRFYDDQKYDLDRFVIMPNHGHVIVQFRSGESLDVISQSWLRYTARQINRETNRKGEFWQGEPFDHLIRSPEQFAYLQQYVAENPAKAKLKDGEFLFWERQ